MNRNLFLIVSIFLGIIATILVGNVITIGDKLGELTHLYVEYAFYIILLLLVAFYLIRPIIRVHRAPEIPILSVNGDWNTKQLREFAKQLAANCNYINDKKLRDKHKRDFLKKIQFHSADVNILRTIISEEIALRMEGSKELNVLGINNRIKEWGKTVFMVTAISQNNKFDTLAVLTMNYKLISDIVLASGFRPTKPQMFKLYVKVLTTALITYCTSQVFTDVDGVAPFDFDDNDMTDNLTEIDADMDVDLDEGGFGTSIMNALKKLEIPGVLVGSVLDGCLNALMTLRIGYVTKSYLTEGAGALSGTKNKRYIKRKALKESFKSMPSVIANGSGAIGKTASSILTKMFKEEKL